jgi:hypothetical protein
LVIFGAAAGLTESSRNSTGLALWFEIDWTFELKPLTGLPDMRNR